MDRSRPTVLFLCTHNTGRSQMAAGWVRHLAGDAVGVLSGDSDPAGALNAAAVAVMAEVGVDIAGASPSRWTDDQVPVAEVVVSMGCGDTHPYYPGKRYEDWDVPDPAGLPVEAVGPIRDEIRRRVEALLASPGVGWD